MPHTGWSVSHSTWKTCSCEAWADSGATALWMSSGISQCLGNSIACSCGTFGPQPSAPATEPAKKATVAPSAVQPLVTFQSRERANLGGLFRNTVRKNRVAYSRLLLRIESTPCVSTLQCTSALSPRSSLRMVSPVWGTVPARACQQRGSIGKVPAGFLYQCWQIYVNRG